MANVRVTPRRFVYLPRIELGAAVLAVKVSSLTKTELEMKELTKYCWTGSKFLLGYIANDYRAFKTFLANRGTSNSRIWQCKPIELLPIR